MNNIIVADRRGRTDSVYHSLKEHLNVDLPIVLVSWVDDFVFNDELLQVKDYAICCYCEYGWDMQLVDSHIWGKNSEQFPRYYSGDWIRFDNWVKDNPPKIQFKRELLKKDVTYNVKPIEYPCSVNLYPLQSKDEYNSRPINVFQYWGRSNENRLRIHGEIWLHSYHKGFQVCDNLYYYNSYVQEEKGEKWITLWIPHYARVDVNQLLKINNLSKLSLSWAGAGFKCFRTAEAPINSIMVIHKNSFAWSYDWDETNCILVEPNKEIEGIENALKRSDLHNVYEKGVRNSWNYVVKDYCKNYIEPLINNHG